jgi:hypothetical protein
LQDIFDFDQQEQSPMTFAERYISVAAGASRLVSTIAGYHPNSSEEMSLSLFEDDVLQVVSQMLDLIEDQMLTRLNYFQWAKYETSRGKQGIGLTLKREYIERKEIKRNIVVLLLAIDSLDPVSQYLKRVCPEPSTSGYQSLADHIEDASNQYPLNPWGKCLLGHVLLGGKTKAKEQKASECFLHAVLLLPSCSSRAQKVILLQSVLGYCCL